MLIGKRVHIDGISHPAIILIKSTFCSKCIYSKKILLRENGLNGAKLMEIDIASKTFDQLRMRIETVPTILVTDKNGNVIGVWKGMLTVKAGNSLINLLRRLSE